MSALPSSQHIYGVLVETVWPYYRHYIWQF